jgi:predicted Zn-dependent peptidase
MEDLNAASEGDYKKFYKTFYVPNNATLVITGDFDPKLMPDLVKKYFGDIPKGGAVPRNKVVEPPMKAEVRDVVYDRIQLPAVVISYRIPAYGTKDFYAVDMLNRLLSSGNSSRLNKQVKDVQQKALYVGSFSLPLEDPGLAIAFGIANMGVTPDSLEAAMDREIDRTRNELVDVRELDKLKAQVETEFVSGNGRVAGIAENLASAHVFLGNAAKANTEVDEYLAVTPQDLQRVAQQYFIRENRVVLHYLPMDRSKN